MMLPPIWQSEVQVRLAMCSVFLQLGTQLICYISGMGGHKNCHRILSKSAAWEDKTYYERK